MPFDPWFDKQGFRHFQAREISRLFSSVRGGVKNSPPPSHLWPSILPTLRILDKLRSHLGKPVLILSAYRSPSYNRAVGGATHSRHLAFDAVDFWVPGVAPSDVSRVLMDWRNAGQFKGGIGTYPGFVHLDSRGTNATW